MLDTLDLPDIPDERTRTLVRQLLNLIETVTADLRAAHADNQRLRDEISRLTGEQGKPTIKPNRTSPSPDHSSEKHRTQPREHVKRAKNPSHPCRP